MKNFFSLVSIVFFFVSSGCNYKEYKAAVRQQSLQMNLLQPTYSSIQAQILTPQCVGCHGGANPRKGIRLEQYTDVMKFIKHDANGIPSRNPNESLLYQVISTGDMPRFSDPLSEAQINAIAIWIQNGANP